MFSAAPPTGAALNTPLTLTHITKLPFPPPTTPALDALNTAKLEEYLSDLLLSHGLGPAAKDPAADGRSYGDMAEALLGLALPTHEPVGLLVLA